MFCGIVVHAQTNTYTLLAPLPQLGGKCPPNSVCNNASSTVTQININTYISYAYKFALALAVVLAVFMITVGGFEYMLSGSVTNKKDAQEKIWNAVLGLLLALCSYLILYTIDPNLIISNLNSFSNLSGQENNLSGLTAAQINQVPVTQQSLVQQASNGAQNAASTPSTGNYPNNYTTSATSPQQINSGTTPTPATPATAPSAKVYQTP